MLRSAWSLWKNRYHLFFQLYSWPRFKLHFWPYTYPNVTYYLYINLYIPSFLGCRCISWKEEKMMTSVQMFLFELALEKKEKSCFSRAFIWSDNFTFWAFFCLNREKDRIVIWQCFLHITRWLPTIFSSIFINCVRFWFEFKSRWYSNQIKSYDRTKLNGLWTPGKVLI